MDYIVDLQGFKRPINEFVLKEISFLEVQGDGPPLTLFFDSPSAWKSLPVKYKAMNLWLTRNYHGMSWEDGEIPYEAAETIIGAILQRARKVYVKGLEKTQWMKKFTNAEIIDLETLDCPSLKKLPKIPPGCSHHSFQTKHNCANANVKSLKCWLKVYQALCNRDIK